MARRTDHQPEFGSDSFLDIVANIVGILIILIVVAGVRVAQAPVLSSVVMPEVVIEEPEVIELLEPELGLPEELVSIPPVVEPEISDSAPEPEPTVVHRELPAVPVFEPLEPARTPENLKKRAAQLTVAREFLETKLKDKKLALAEKQRQLTLARDEVAGRSSELTGVDNTIQKQRINIVLGEQAVAELEQSVSLLKRELRDAEKPTEDIVTLKHELTPVGREVTGKEIHFRLAGNKVSYVPIMELAEQVQHELERRKQYLLNRPFFQGTIGPIDGYLMDYLLQRESLSLVEEMRMGRAGIRIALSGWQITPTPDMVPETVEDALRGDSQFIQKLRTADPTSTVTFWVYPDSFESHSQLKSYIHELGLWVASRPLPEGIPIQGSPNGSKSLAQ